MTPDQIAALSKFVPNGSGQDNQWSDPSLASPLASLTHYLGGMNWYGDTTSTDVGTGANPLNELYTTGAYDKNVTPQDDANASLQAALATARKYDPNATLEYYNPTAGSEGGNGQQMVRINMDQSKLPPQPDFSKYGGAQLLSNVRTANNQTPDAGQGPHLYDQSAVYMDPNWGPLTFARNVNQNYGQNPLTDVGFWGPAIVAMVTGGAGMGMLPGFGGMSDAAAQAAVAGAAGEGAGSAGTASSILGMSPGKAGSAFLGTGRQVTSGQGVDLSTIASVIGQLSGIPGGGKIASLITSAVQNGTLSPAQLISLLPQLSSLTGSGGGK